MFTPEQVQEFYTLMTNAQKIAVCGHIDPDGDSIGSCLGLGLWLQTKGKSVRYFVPTLPSDVFSFLPEVTLFEDHIPTEYTPDLWISLDTAERQRSSLANRATEKSILHIDHHPTDAGRGTHNLINENANSVCELILFLLEQHDAHEITAQIATVLFLGLSTDTGHFMRGKDLGNWFGAAQRLIWYGADRQRIIHALYRSNDFSGIQVVWTLLQNMHHEGEIIRTSFDWKELEEQGLDETKIEILLMLITSIKHDGIFLLFKSYEHAPTPYLKCSLRTKNPAIDVARLAHQFGGGGHKAAAWCRVVLENTSAQAMREQMKKAFSEQLSK